MHESKINDQKFMNWPQTPQYPYKNQDQNENNNNNDQQIQNQSQNQRFRMLQNNLISSNPQSSKKGSCNNYFQYQKQQLKTDTGSQKNSYLLTMDQNQYSIQSQEEIQQMNNIFKQNNSGNSENEQENQFRRTPSFSGGKQNPFQQINFQKLFKSKNPSKDQQQNEGKNLNMLNKKFQVFFTNHDSHFTSQNSSSVSLNQDKFFSVNQSPKNKKNHQQRSPIYQDFLNNKNIVQSQFIKKYKDQMKKKNNNYNESQVYSCQNLCKNAENLNENQEKQQNNFVHKNRTVKKKSVFFNLNDSFGKV
ncbi:hypothetical protein PPERSA_08452 [Pseudocohnilembus persalinus]|uniref:Uncharacterized protein n=1 Tax=Pseudocohnilembus persalinus TaxID=266149 RepID=A0A0V0R6C8_PSEPJ|nr:hypothetical protein PPERSA_08452 [Pseudocohnilembus persalinus]|eukprot:KRX10049.1 hypothetical protein PPERSA_08452 [Pseudocohnilembus persalinus]